MQNSSVRDIIVLQSVLWEHAKFFGPATTQKSGVPSAIGNGLATGFPASSRTVGCREVS